MSLLGQRLNTLGAAYPVQLPIFAGPLELLLSLIERQELDITTVSLVAVTDSYLQALEALEAVQPEALSDFLVIASRLLYLKSRSLLPKPQPPDDVEGEEGEGDGLIRQLLEYKRFKQIAESLRVREEAGLRAFGRQAPLPVLERTLDLESLQIEQLYRAMQRALKRIPTEPPLPTVRSYAVTVAEQIERVRRQLYSQAGGGEGGQAVRFATLLSRSHSRVEVIVTFLAVLELIKLQEIRVEQSELFGEIVLSPLPPTATDTAD